MDDRRTRLVHPFPPVWDGNSRLLVLGSFPSVKSREDGFYYGNRSNRFWPVMEGIFGERPCTRDEKISFLLSHSIALWDSIASCNIVGSSDASILDAVPNDIPFLIKHSRIERIAANGSRAYDIYMKHIYPSTGFEALKLPSTSPANASWRLPALIEAWKEALMPKDGEDAIIGI